MAIPHIGTSYGHAVRLGEYLKSQKKNDVTVALPENKLEESMKYFPDWIKVVTRKNVFQITSNDGILDIHSFQEALLELGDIIKNLQPDYLIGDPGIFTGILSANSGIPWSGLMHGIYLQMPEEFPSHFSKDFQNLLFHIFLRVRKDIDELVVVGTNGMYRTWTELQKTGDVTDMSSFSQIDDDTCKVIDRPILEGKDQQLLITICSENMEQIPAGVQKELSKNNKLIIAGGKDGKMMNYHEVIDTENTTVITHCGAGTLEKIKHAKKVVLYPGDIDQLTNALLAYYKNANWKIVFDRDWLKVLESENPYKRGRSWEKNIVKQILENIG